ncbi:MAG TPA: DUF2207 domain-containing protein [Candidatus Methanoperedenaceae archaeon]|nr:DUF2207 domain-containing protein [Candidatus Methanoperedenaceae archaeon]
MSESSEKKQIAILLVVVTLIGMAGLFLTGGFSNIIGICTFGCGDVYVDSYSADLYLNGTLEETFVYRIEESDTYRMLYRNWKVPLSYGSPGDKTTSWGITVGKTPHVELITIDSPDGAIPYIKDFQENTTILSDSNQEYASQVSSLASMNEAGGYKSDRFKAGTYRIRYVFKVFPPFECDSEYCHLNLKLTDDHLPYDRVTVTIHDPDGFISQVFVHSLAQEVRKERETWIITGASSQDSLLGIEMLLNPKIIEVMQGFPKSVPGVKEKTLSANERYSTGSLIYRTLKATVFLIPVILALMYYKFGREKSFTVP